MTDTTATESTEDTGPDWAAITTNNQFGAIDAYIKDGIKNHGMWQSYAAGLHKRDRKKVNIDRVRVLLVNAWNTERLLENTGRYFTGEGSGFVAQWAFPQAYYTAYNSTLASFIASGYTQTSHTAVRKVVAEMASKKALPDHFNVFSDGGIKHTKVEGLTSSHSDFHPARIDYDNPENIKSHIIHYFLSTRKMYLEEKKYDVKIISKTTGKPKKSYNPEDWEKVSNSIGKTSWLCLFYRKRIKSNYQDIDTFLSKDFRTSTVLRGLVSFTHAFNLANEINICNILGTDQVFRWITRPEYTCTDRLAYIRDTVFNGTNA